MSKAVLRGGTIGAILFVYSLFSGCSLKPDKSSPAPDPEVARIMMQPTPVPPGHMEPHWGYAGKTGPSAWGEMRPEYAQCKVGQRQSPIDLIWKRPTAPAQLAFAYKPSEYTIEDNGHSVVVTVPPGQTANIRGQTYELLQFHFHAPAEHTISGRRAPIEIHFVHRNLSGGLGVIGVMVEEGQAAHPTVEALWAHLPKQPHRPVAVTDKKVDPSDLVPSTLTYYNYNGSLTTPPCSEAVNWNVLNTPIQWSREQIDQFRAHYQNNARPLQPLHGRKVINF